MKIRIKLLFLISLVVVSLLVLSLLTLFSLTTMREFNGLTRKGYALNAGFQTLSSSTKELLITANLDGAMKTWIEVADRFGAQFESYTSSPELQRLIVASGKESVLDTFTFLWQTSRKDIQLLKDRLKVLIDRHTKDKMVVTGLMLGFATYNDPDFVSAMSQAQRMAEMMSQKIAESLQELINAAIATADELELRLVWSVPAIAGLTIVVTVVFFLLFMRGMTTRLTVIGSSMGRIMRRDFSVAIDVKGRDELAEVGRAVNGFIQDFSAVIHGVKRIGAEARELREEVNSAGNESSAALIEMTANIESIGKKIHELADNLSRSLEAVKEIAGSLTGLDKRIEEQSEFVSRSTAAVEQMNASIESVTNIAVRREEAAVNLVAVTKSGGETIEDASAMVRRIVAEVQEITETITVIDDIATQTNLLSMNAAIEAAHAGAAGRGFAVVAEEIRKLAESTNENSQKIDSMIKSISSGIEDVLASSDKSRTAFDAVDREVKTTTEAMREISTSMRELSGGSRDIMSAVTKLAELNKVVRGESSRMLENTGRSSKAMENVNQIGEVVRNGMDEIQIGVRHINEAMLHITELNVKSGESIDKLNDEVDCFKTADAVETEAGCKT